MEPVLSSIEPCDNEARSCPMPSPSRPPVLVHPTPLVDPRIPHGWRSQVGFVLPEEPWDLSDRHLVAAGTIGSEADAEAALQALARGVGLIVSIGVDGDLRHRVLEDLHRLGEVHQVEPVEAGLIDLDDDEGRLLDALSSGATVAGAADALHISLRTTNRRLARIRTRLGVSSTAEAVIRWASQRPDS